MQGHPRPRSRLFASGANARDLQVPFFSCTLYDRGISLADLAATKRLGPLLPPPQLLSKYLFFVLHLHVAVWRVQSAHPLPSHYGGRGSAAEAFAMAPALHKEPPSFPIRQPDRLGQSLARAALTKIPDNDFAI